MDVLESISTDDRTVLTEYEAMAVLADYGIPVQEGELAETAEEAVEYAETIGYPVVLKVMSPDIVHKSDAGVVGLDVQDEEELRETWDDLLENASAYAPEADIDGVLVTPMAEEGIEVIIGMNRDPQFGPVVMFGLGGIFVEVLEDVAFRVAPVDEREAESMIEAIDGYPVLAGARGEEPVDREALIDIIVAIGDLATDLPIEELDLNPVFAYPDGAVAIDASMILREEAGVSQTAGRAD